MKNQGTENRERGWATSLVGSGFFIVLLAGSLPAAPLNGTVGPKSAITVRVCDYARVSPATLQGAELIAAKILRKARVETAWLECPPNAVETAASPACQQPLGAADIVLRILPRVTVGQGVHGEVALGVALVPRPNEWGTYASVFFQPVEAFASDGVASQSQILGHAIAHEIGHLLLRSDQHSAVGIMRARWNQEDLQRASRGNLLFTPEQSELIRAEARARTRRSEVVQVVPGSGS